MIQHIGLHLKVKNFKKSVSFYKNLGFKPVFEYGPEKAVKEDHNGIVFEHGGTKFEIADGHRAVKELVFKQRIKSSKMSLMIQMDRITSIMELCNKHNISIELGPRHYYWGTLEMVIKDPDGLILVFIAPYTKVEAHKLRADETFANSMHNKSG